MSILKAAIATRRWDLAAHVIIFASILTLSKGASTEDEKTRIQASQQKQQDQ